VQGAKEDGGAARVAAVESGAARGAAEVRETSLGWNPDGTAEAVRGSPGAQSPGGLPGWADKSPQ
jgi:hypothetical protein